MTYSTQPAVSAISPALLIQIRAYREKHKPHAPHDPLAIEKVRVHRYLIKHGHSSDELPPDFWEQDRDIRGFIVGQVLGADSPAGEARAAKREAKRLESLERRGYPVDYDFHTYEERRRISAAVRSRRRRAPRAPEAKASPLVGLPVETVTHDWMADKLARINLWVKGATPLARQLRGRERELVKVAAVYQMLCARTGRQPSHAELARNLGCTRAAAQNKRRLLVRLYSSGGPWYAKV